MDKTIFEEYKEYWDLYIFAVRTQQDTLFDLRNNNFTMSDEEKRKTKEKLEFLKRGEIEARKEVQIRSLSIKNNSDFNIESIVPIFARLINEYETEEYSYEIRRTESGQRASFSKLNKGSTLEYEEVLAMESNAGNTIKFYGEKELFPFEEEFALLVDLYYYPYLKEFIDMIIDLRIKQFLSKEEVSEIDFLQEMLTEFIAIRRQTGTPSL